MPFITQERRQKINERGLRSIEEIKPGDRCYVCYQEMVDRWKQEPGWTTAHLIYQRVLSSASVLDQEWRAARELAWQVFFQLYVMPYELKKRDENGDI